MVSIPDDQLWMVIVGFIIAFFLAFGIGANDVANTFGTSVGAKVLSLRQACILATIFETLGAVFLGAKVSDTIRKGIIDTSPYANNTEQLMMGNVAALSGSCLWLFMATLLRMPVSATHSIVGATVGFALVAHGAKGINWYKMSMIIGSWFISPVLAGIISTILFFIIKKFILIKEKPLEPGLRWLPVFYSFTVIVNIFSVFYDGPEMFSFHLIPLWGTFVISFGCGLITLVVVRILVVPWQRRRITDRMDKLYAKGTYDPVLMETHLTTGSPDTKDTCTKDDAAVEANHNDVQKTDETAPSVELRDVESPLVTPAPVESNTNNTPDLKSKGTTYKLSNPSLRPPVDGGSAEKGAAGGGDGDSTDGGRVAVKDDAASAMLFSFLQILTAIFGAFAHGGNDVSNAIGPLVSLWLLGTTQLVTSQAITPIWILLYGGVGISIGLWLWGRRVIKTLGEDLTKITPSSGFCIEIGSAFTVLFASNIGIPISTTHCKVGSVVFVGRFRSRDNVDWSIFRNIVLAWVVTLPASGAVSAAIMAAFQAFL